MIVKRIFAVLFVVCLAVSVGLASRHLSSLQTPTLSADGGRPVPPVPPNSGVLTPISAPTQTLEADGGRPVPPVPPNSALMKATTCGNQTQWADGGRPVPPVPPSSSGNSTATATA